MRTTTFLWGYDEYAPLPDKHMTRARLARLLRAWRRSTTQGRRDFTLELVSRTAAEHVYRVGTTAYINNEHATVVVQIKKGS